MDKKPDHKPAPKPRKPKVDIDAKVVELAQEMYEKRLLKEREEAKAILPAVQVEPIPPVATIPVVVPEHHTPIEDVEEKAIGIWGKVKAWKWFWFVVGGLALILVVLGYQWVNGIQNKRADAKTEKKKEELKQIEVSDDNSILKQRIIESNRMKLIDSIYDATLHALTDLKKVLDYQKVTLPKQADIINGEYIRAHENINNPANSDDDVRRNAESQMSKQQAIPRRQAINN